MAAYSFLTTWCLESRVEPVWDAIVDAERWPEWWRGVESVEELEAGGPLRIGSLARHTWRSRLPYSVVFESRTTVVEPHRLIEGTADGELRGIGRWRFYEATGTTVVLYEWNVETTARWMNLIAPLARPAFRWNHDWVMHNGGEGLAKLLGVRLLAAN